VENATAANRALTVFDDIKKYVSETAKRLPHNSTCSTVITACNDKSLKPQLAFFASVANDFEPFLKKYQTAAPMVPYLYDDVGVLLRALMTRFIKKTVVSEAKQLSQLV